MRRLIIKFQSGTTRIRKGFLWIPRSVIDGNNLKETRWLEMAEWEETYQECAIGNYWKTIKWLNN